MVCNSERSASSNGLVSDVHQHASGYSAILSLLVKYSSSELVQQLRSEEDFEVDTQSTAREARELAEDLQSLGPVYIKLGQFLSTQTQIIPDEYCDALEELQDRVEPASMEEIAKIVYEEFDEDQAAELLNGIDHTPLATASLGQVYRATLPTGRPVVVKVQRPGVYQRLLLDFKALEKIAKLLDRVSLAQNYSFTKNVSQFKRSMLRELDYREEAQNLVKLREVVLDYDLLYVPRPIERYSSKRVLTMDRVSGSSLNELNSEELAESDPLEIAEQLFQSYLKQMLIEGFVHVDPHPGNLLLDPDGRLAVIDAGMVVHLPRQTREQLFKVIQAISDGRGETVADAVVLLGSAGDQFSRSDFQEQIAELVAEQSDKPLSRLSPGKIVVQISRIARDAGLNLPTHFTILGQTLMKLDRVGKLLAPDFDPQESIQRNNLRLLMQRVRNDFSLEWVADQALDYSKLISQLPTYLNQAIEKIAHNELKVDVDAIDENKLIDGLHKIANRITAGLVIAALIIGAASMMQVETSWTILDYPGLAIILFALAVVLGLYLVISIFLSD